MTTDTPALDRHEPTQMVFERRAARKHRFVIRCKPCERDVWYRVYGCPVCGRAAYRLDSLWKGKPAPICSGEKF